MNWIARLSSLTASALFSAALLAQSPAAPRVPTPQTAGPEEPPPFGVVAYPSRPPGDRAAIGRGKALYGVNCTFCHGVDAHGGDGGGPNLLRSAAVLEDRSGERLTPIVQGGRGTMPPFQLTVQEIADMAEFLHSFPVSSQPQPSTLNILVGDAKKGEAYVAAKCAPCHTTDSLKALAEKVRDPIALQQMWLMPGSGGRGAPPIPAPPTSAIVTLPSGEKVEGVLDRIDDFTVSLTQEDGRRRSFRTIGTAIKVAIRDPLQPHKQLLGVYTDADIHDVTAYIASLGPAR